MPRALVRRPSPRLGDGLLTHLPRTPVDAALALAQWEGYVAALAAAGWEPVELPPLDDCPDGVFVEDTVVVRGDLAVVTRPGAPQRRPETRSTEDALRALGYRVAHVRAPGTLEGGDVLQVGATVLVGRSDRTDDDGVRQLAAHLAPRGAHVVPVPVTRVLHLKSAMTALPDGTLLGYAPLLDDVDALPGEVLRVPEESGSAVVRLGPGDDGRERLLMAASAPRTAGLLRERGSDVVVVDVGELERLEGCVTCLSVRLREPPRGRG